MSGELKEALKLPIMFCDDFFYEWVLLKCRRIHQKLPSADQQNASASTGPRPPPFPPAHPNHHRLNNDPIVQPETLDKDLDALSSALGIEDVRRYGILLI